MTQDTFTILPKEVRDHYLAADMPGLTILHWSPGHIIIRHKDGTRDEWKHSTQTADGKAKWFCRVYSLRGK